MVDRLEELLLPQQEESDESLWWNVRSGRAVFRAQEQQAMFPDEIREQGQAAQEERTAHRATDGETPDEVLARAWVVQMIERTRRAARAAALGGTVREKSRSGGGGTQPVTGSRASATLKDSPAGGWQGLTAQIDAQFRRDARRYDGRLGLL